MWSDKTTDEDIPLDDDRDGNRSAELEGEESLLLEPDDDDDMIDDIAWSGGRLDYDQVPEDEADLDYWTLTSDVLIVHHRRDSSTRPMIMLYLYHWST